jgi:DNA-binding MarR family transcriptional regulator
MPLLLLKDLPRYECLLESAREFPELDPSACVAYLNLLRAGDEVFSIMERYLAAHNISQGRFSVLMLLWKSSPEFSAQAQGNAGCGAERPHTPAELADAAGVTRATMTGLIDTLERDDLARREPDAKDRRMMAVQLTAKGVAFLQNMLPGYFRLMASLMQPLSEAERKTMVKLAHKLLQQASTLSVSAPAGATS